MKKMKKILCIIVLLVSMVSQPVGTSLAFDTVNDYRVDDRNNVEDMVIINQENALIAYEKIVSNFDITEAGNISYPVEYGGEYIDKEVLVIQLVDMTTEMKEKYLAMCDYSDNVRFENVEYSLNYLNNIYTYGDNLKDMYEKIGYGVDRKNNIVLLQLLKKKKTS